MPDNSYFDRRMANGEKLSDIFDDIDYQSKVYSQDKERPITVRVGKLYNYVSNNYILFDNWFVVCDDFEEFDKYSYAYRRFNEKGIREGGVLIRRDGSYVTREEFIDIQFRDYHGHLKYAIVKQYDGNLNIVDVDKGIKLEKTGIQADYIKHNFIDIFIIVKGKISKEDEELLWGTSESEEIARKNHLKFNLYNAKMGIISPSLWFDFVEPFKYETMGYRAQMHNHTIVHLNGKRNYIDQKGRLLSETWFDVAKVYYTGEGLAGILKSENLRSLPEYLDDNYDFNPNKYNLFKIDKFGGIKKM